MEGLGLFLDPCHGLDSMPSHHMSRYFLRSQSGQGNILVKYEESQGTLENGNRSASLACRRNKRETHFPLPTFPHQHLPDQLLVEEGCKGYRILMIKKKNN